MKHISTVMQRKEGEWNWTQNKTNIYLVDSDKVISSTLQKSLFNYAKSQIINYGFPLDLFTECEVYTMDADKKVDDRYYTVRFMTDKGGGLEVCGIMLKNYKPFLDHGVEFTTG